VDNDCPAGLSCNPASKLCVWYCDPQSAIQCDTSTVCIPVEPKHSPTGGFCFKKCDPALTDPGCKAGVDNVGEICLSIGQAGTNVCVRKCTTNDQCPTDNVCDPGTGQCNPTGPPKCASSTECNSWEDCRTDEANPADTTTYCLPKGCTDDTICGTDALCMKENGAQTGHCNPKCQRNEDCPPDHTCDPNTSMCKPPEPVSCASDGDCATDHYCDQTDNQCKPKQPTCTENSQCPSTNYGCDLTDNKCWPKCDVPADCPAGLSCNPNTNLCVWYCDPNGSNQCDTNTVCIPVDTTYSPTGGYCLKKCDPAFTDPGCKMGSDNWGEACITLGQNAINVCVRRCKSDSECRPGVCDIATGKCGPAELPKCTDGTECNSWEECKKDENNLSDTNTYCLPKGCTTDSDCGADGAVCDETTKTCHSGTVQPACNVDSDCTADHFCDQADNQCKPKQTACTEDSQCPTDHFCDQADNQCKPKQTACTEDSQCYEGFVCEQTTKKCWPKCDVDTDCPAGPTCNPDTNICAWFCTPGQMNQCDANTLCVPVTTNISPTGGMCLKKCDPTNPTTCKTGIDRVTEVCQPWTTGEAFCKPPCKEDKDCDDGSNSLICNDATGLCEAGTGGF